jgi:acetate kinase
MRGARAPDCPRLDRMNTILVVNSGSSSVKFEIFAAEDSRLRRLIRGQMSGIGVAPKLRAEDGAGAFMLDKSLSPMEIPDVSAALAAVGEWLREHHNMKPIAVGHRVVHGGPDFSRPVLVDQGALRKLDQYVSLAPLHQPNNLAAIRSIRARSPDLPQVACFDTAFHRGHGDLADHYALPAEYYELGVRRYGFHGLSYEFIASRLPEVAPQVAAGRVIVAHLGSGASMCAMLAGRSVECSMGFTALDGLPMGTRVGQIDPGVVFYLIEERGMTAAQVQNFFYHECGLKGLSGVSNDVRELEASRDERAEFALEYFSYRIGLYAGMLAAALGGLDAFVFTAGIGENSASVRARVARRLAWLGADIDTAANARHDLLLSRPGSRLPLFVIPTDEEITIARSTMDLLAGASRKKRWNESAT